MKQQQQRNKKPSQGHRLYSSRQSLDVRHVGKRTGIIFENLNPKDKQQTWGRWSDYLSEYGDDELIPQEATDTLQDINREKTETKIDIDSKSQDASQEIIYIKTVKDDQIEPISKNRSNSNSYDAQQARDKVPNRLIPIPNDPVQVNQVSSKEPFSAVGVSDIKKKWSEGGRKSEQYLLELLKTSNQKRRQQQEQEERQKLENERNKQNNQKKQQQPQKQDKINKQRKRVTINDKGKVKLPTDSISLEFQPLLPPSLRKGLESSYHKRLRPEQQPDDDLDQEDSKNQKKKTENNTQQYQNGSIKKVNEPMDIILDQNYDLPSIPQEKTESLPIRPRETIKFQTTKSESNLVQTKNNSKGRSKSRKGGRKPSRSISKDSNNDQDPKTTVGKNSSKQQKPIKEIEKQRRKQRKNELKSISQTQPIKEHVEQKSRPKRTRTSPCKFWLNEKPVYKPGNQQRIIFPKMSPLNFLEILGFAERVLTSIDCVLVDKNKGKFLINLEPKQTIRSRGLDEQLMSKNTINPSEINGLVVSLLKNTKVPLHLTVNGRVFYMKTQKKNQHVQKGSVFSIYNGDEVVNSLIVYLWRR